MMFANNIIFVIFLLYKKKHPGESCLFFVFQNYKAEQVSKEEKQLQCKDTGMRLISRTDDCRMISC